MTADTTEKEIAMDDSKEWWKSRTVWGALVALAGSLASAAGVSVEPGVQSEAVAALTALATALGALIALFGRFEARSRIG